MTETSPTITQTDKDDPIERRVGTVGGVAPHVEIRSWIERAVLFRPGSLESFLLEDTTYAWLLE